MQNISCPDAPCQHQKFAPYCTGGKNSMERRILMQPCMEIQLLQHVTSVKTSRINSKADQVIKTTMELWHDKTLFSCSAHLKTELKRFINRYDGLWTHEDTAGLSPEGNLLKYFYPNVL